MPDYASGATRRERRRALTGLALLVPAAVVAALFLYYPLAFIVQMSFTLANSYLSPAGPTTTVANYEAMVSRYLPNLAVTIRLAGLATVADLIFGVPFAYILVRKVRYRDLVRALMAFPLFGVLYLSFGLSFIFLPDTFFGKILVALGFNPVNFLYSTPTVLFALAVGTFPFMVVNVATALQNVDVTLEEAAAALGANGWQTFTRVLLPLTRSGLLAGSLMCFGWNLGVYIVPLLLGTTDDQNVLAVNMYIKAVKNNDYGMAAAQGIVLMLLASVVTYVSLRYSRGALAE